MQYAELGKPEIIFRSIEEAISKGQRVGYVAPRREVVKEIYNRFVEVYPSLNIALVFGGHNEYLNGDIVCLTCHQCYRYKDKFGLVILDEYDAFPLKGDNTLLNLVKKTCYGKIIYLSATFAKEELLGKTSASLNRRYHEYDIPIPEIICTHFQIPILLKTLHRNRKSPNLIFAPTIKRAKYVNRILNLLGLKSYLFTSKTINKDELFAYIKTNGPKVIVCTTILERGITIKNVNVIVYKANHKIFDKATLIQITGRVGRKIGSETGKVYYLCNKVSLAMEDSIETLMRKNNGYQ